MGTAHVGAGGWGYFAGGLEAYASAFRFVEVNASFYRRIPEARARRWRARVPADFVFAVKAHRDITHGDRLRATPSGRRAFAHDLRIARILGAPFAVLETPANLPIGAAEIAGLRELATMVEDGVRIGLEARAHRGTTLPPDLRRLMEDLAILDVVDLSQSTPRVEGDTVYSRLFGPGPHNLYEFDDDELRTIDRSGRDPARAAFTFHGVHMYKDAARFLTFKRTGRFPFATGSRGLASLDEVLRPDARFPATSDELVRDHGWKMIDLDATTRVHAARLLEALPPRRFRSLEEVLREVAIPAVRQRSSEGHISDDRNALPP